MSDYYIILIQSYLCLTFTLLLKHLFTYIHWARHNSRSTFESTSGQRRVVRLQPDVSSRKKVELINCGEIINWVRHDFKATLKAALRKDCIFQEPRIAIYNVTYKCLKSQNFQTKQMQLATITLKTVYTQWAHIKGAEVWDDQKMFQIFRSHVFFPWKLWIFSEFRDVS